MQMDFSINYSLSIIHFLIANDKVAVIMLQFCENIYFVRVNISPERLLFLEIMVNKVAVRTKFNRAGNFTG